MNDTQLKILNFIDNKNDKNISHFIDIVKSYYYNNDLPRYTTPPIIPSLLVDENGNYIISEDGFGVLVMVSPIFVIDEEGNYLISECGFRIIA
jgi:hypothetical protein